MAFLASEVGCDPNVKEVKSSTLGAAILKVS